MKKQVSNAIVQNVVERVVKALAPASSEKQSNNNKSATNRRKRRKKSKGRITVNTGNNRITALNMPLTLGYQLGPSTFNISSSAQKVSSSESATALRVSGQGLCWWTLNGNSNNLHPIHYGNAYFSYLPLSGVYVDDRLQQFERMYSKYAFRYVKLTYVPNCSTQGVASSLALGLTSDYTSFTVNPDPTQQNILELSSSTLTVAWSSTSVDYRYNGTDTWETSSDSVNPQEDRIQIGLAACANTPVVDGLSYGQVVMQYVVDYYSPSMIHNAVNADHKSKLIQGLKSAQGKREVSEDDSGNMSHPGSPTGGSKTVLIPLDTSAFKTKSSVPKK